MKISKSLLSVGLFLGATSAVALSLGEVRGSVVLGRPLDVLFDVQPDPGVVLDAACLTATATVGDTLIDNSRMQISVVPAVAGHATAVRVRLRVLINEPILSVQLSAGCNGMVSRTYHLFADPPAPLAAAVLPVLPSARRPTAEAVAASGAETPTTLPRRAQPAPSRIAAAPLARTAPVVKGVREAPPRRRPAEPAEQAITVPTSRLVIEPLEDWLLLPPALRLSSDLQTLPSQEPSPERAQAAAQWKALNLSVGDSAEQAARALALSAQAEAERATAAKAQSTVSALQQRLDRLEAERFSPALVYALLALLAATLAGWVWYALRTRRHIAAATANWSDAVSESAARQAEREGPLGRQARASGNAGLLDKDLELFLQENGEAENDARVLAVAPAAPALTVPPVAAVPFKVSAPAPVAAHAAPLVPVAPVMPAVHVVQPEEFFDVQQQAEFFVSVGEHDQAIEVMSKHIAQNHAASPWAYLELLRLYRSLSRVGPFNQLRAQFQQHFNAEVPEFSAFHQVNRGLLDYPEVLARIEALWSDDAVGPLLEGLLFCRDGAAPMERFDLCAYDDLLMLYAIARTTPASTRGAPQPRQRTTPVGAAELPASLAPPDPLELEDFDSLTLSEAPAPTAAAAAADNMIEYDLLLPRQSEPAVLTPLDMTLDIDLSEPDWKDSLRLPSLTLSDLPAVPVTAAPAPGQAVGFGANSDRVEARFDLEERKPDAP